MSHTHSAQLACADIANLTNGDTQYSAGFSDIRPEGSTVTLSCVAGYSLVGESERTCLTNGNWSGSTDPAVCQGTFDSVKIMYICTLCVKVYGLLFNTVITCSGSISLLNGTISFNHSGFSSGKPIGTVAAYSCDTSHVLIGNNTRTCHGDGTWSGTEPTCECNQTSIRVSVCPLICMQ